MLGVSLEQHSILPKFFQLMPLGILLPPLYRVSGTERTVGDGLDSKGSRRDGLGRFSKTNPTPMTLKPSPIPGGSSSDRQVYLS